MKHQWMPLFWGDLFANTLHLSAQEFGAYVLLIGHAWEHNAQIPVADLQRVARVTNFQWKRIHDRLAPFFSTSNVSNIWYHGRVHTELTLAAEISNKRKGAAQQMHTNRAARAEQMHPPHPTYKKKRISTGKQAQNGAYRPSGISPDKGDDYRAPPSPFKSDNSLSPIPDRVSAPRADIEAIKQKSRMRKEASEVVSDELKNIVTSK